MSDFISRINNLLTETIWELDSLRVFKDSSYRAYKTVSERNKELKEAVEKKLKIETFSKDLVKLRSLKMLFETAGYTPIDETSNLMNKVDKAVIIYACTIFDFFLSQTQKYLLLAHPKVLGSKQKTIPFHELVTKPYEIILSSIIDKEVYETAYKRIDERIRYIAKTFEFDLVDTTQIPRILSDEINFKSLVEVFAIRNVIVHNKGIVNLSYLKQIPNSEYHEGQHIKIPDSLLADIVNLLILSSINFVRQIEMRYD